MSLRMLKWKPAPGLSWAAVLRLQASLSWLCRFLTLGPVFLSRLQLPACHSHHVLVVWVVGGAWPQKVEFGVLGLPLQDVPLKLGACSVQAEAEQLA